MKKDSGIAKLHNGVLIPEELRDRLSKRDWTSKPTTGPAWNPDNATTKELEEHQFSGYRVNIFTQDVELWCVGRLMEKEKLSRIQAKPSLLATMHEKAFQTNGTVLEVDADTFPTKTRRAKPRGKPRRS